MVVFGGRLGTVLVETGRLRADEVEAQLSRHLGVPCAPPDRVLRPERAALQQVGRDLAWRHQLLPMWIEKGQLHAALLDPVHPDRVDAVSSAVGLGVVPYAIAESRLVTLLGDHYGMRPDAGAPVVGRARARLAPARSATERIGLEADLAMTGERDDVVPTALRIAASHARAAACFAVRDGMIRGVAAGGAAGDPIDGLAVPASEPSLLATAARGAIVHGSPGRQGVDAIVARWIGGGEPREAAIVPISVRASVVQLLYVDNGPDLLPASSLAAVGALGDEVSAAWSRLIGESTRRHC
jgi:hypothetical protein